MAAVSAHSGGGDREREAQEWDNVEEWTSKHHKCETAEVPISENHQSTVQGSTKHLFCLPLDNKYCMLYELSVSSCATVGHYIKEWVQLCFNKTL